MSARRPRGLRHVRSVAVDHHIIIREGIDQLLRDGSTVADSLKNGTLNNFPPGITAKSDGTYHCVLCNAWPHTEAQLDQHLKGKRHLYNVLWYSLAKKRNTLIADKEDVKISSSSDGPDGTLVINGNANNPVNVQIEITNTSESDSLILRNCELLKGLKAFQVDKVNPKKGIDIAQGETFILNVKFRAKQIGYYKTPIAFLFYRPEQPDTNIHIVRFLSGICTNKLIEELKPKEPYKRLPRAVISQSKADIIRGEPPASDGTENLEKEVKLDLYQIPSTLRRIINHGLSETSEHSDKDNAELIKIRTLLKGEPTAANQKDRFKTLLFIEEIQMEYDIRKYDMENVTMEVCKDRPRLHILKVPGLIEKRPSVLKGDSIYVRKLGSDGKPEDNKEYEGRVHNVTMDEVWLGFHSKLGHIRNRKYSVRFSFNRLPMRVMHRALELADKNNLGVVLYPAVQNIGSKDSIIDINDSNIRNIKLYDRLLEGNSEQMSAVQHIVAGTSRPAPYLLFGPPGTGKTVTIAESIKQVLGLIRSATVLACAPSNSAADLLTMRLLKHIQKNHIYRLHALSRSWSEIPDDVKAVSNYDKTAREFIFPCKKDLSTYRIIISTLTTAGRIASAKFPYNHFTHVFIDEAGYSMEPEAMIAFAGIMDTTVSKGGQLVLAGDPEQLGPILRSPIAKKFNLDISLLERLMKHCDIYKRNPDAVPHYDKRLLTKLVKNYRSHPAILKMPNEMFYDNELEAHADELLRKSLCQWSELPKKGFPIIFHGVEGEDTREAKSPSFFNPEEVVTVIDYVNNLLAARGPGIKVNGSDIGIISPYRMQVQKIQNLLSKKNLKDVKVGSVEEFQGQERRVIIISTVRSQPKHIQMDIDYKLGFLQNPKRFNVAITRTQALLIVIGNPSLLAKDEHWNRFLQYCVDNGGYKGCEYEKVDDQMEKLVKSFDSMSFKIKDLLFKTCGGLENTALNVSRGCDSSVFPSGRNKCLDRLRTFVVKNLADWQRILPSLEKDLKEIPVIGFDCEWVSGKTVGKVALIQLATHSGLCVLFRSCKFSEIPDKLEDILENKRIIKAGSGIMKQDSEKLTEFGIALQGCVELGNLVRLHEGYFNMIKKDALTYGLKTLANLVIDEYLEKDDYTIHSQWESDKLNGKQIEYASRDAAASIDIFLELVLSHFRVDIKNVTIEKLELLIKKMCDEITDKGILKNEEFDSISHVQTQEEPEWRSDH